MIVVKNQELDLERAVNSSPLLLTNKRTAIDAFDTDASDNDSLSGLEQYLTADASRLTLKWELSKSNKSKLIVGVNTYLPLDASRGCFSLELPHEKKSPKDGNDSTRIALFRFVSTLSRLSPRIRQLDLEGFGSKEHNESVDIEDVFEAFSKHKSWKSVTIIRTWNCDMNSCRRLRLNEYPQGLEEVYVHDPKGSVLSSSIFQITSRSKKLGRFYIFDCCDKTNRSNDNNNNDARHNNHINRHRFNGSRMTASAIDTLCEVLSASNRLLEMSQLPFREILQLPEEQFCKIVEATTKTPSSLKISRILRFPVVPPFQVSRLTILATRSETLRFYLLYKRSLEILRNPSKRKLAPFVLQNCQTTRRSTKQYIPYGKNDLLFAMLQDSLQGILER